jgi:hemolysin D
VKAIHVQDGNYVKQGQLLVELDPTFSGADLARIKKEVAYYNLELERLMAEKENRGFQPQMSPDLDAKDIDFQLRLFDSRRNEFKAKVATAESNIRQAEASLNIAYANRTKYAALYEIAKEKEARIQQLVNENAVAFFVLLDHRSNRLELEQNLSAQSAEITRNEFVIMQSREQLAAIIAERDRDINTKMVEDRRQAVAYSEEIKKAAEKDRLSRIMSPVEGRVTQLALHTVGGVVTEAQPLMVIVPNDSKLVVESWAANKDIGFIQVGQRAEVKIETFSFQKYGTIGAEVVEISPDAVDDKEKGRVYRVVLQIDKDHVFINDKKVFLSPGMTASAEIKIKQKRIIEFFLDPFRQYQSEALRER